MNSHWSNYHCHSVYSDGAGIPEDYILQAISMGITSIGISEHAPVPFHTTWNMPADKCDNYFSMLNGLKTKYKPQIEVYTGLEIDYIAEHSQQILALAHTEKLDYSIGSIHFLNRKNNGEFWNTDGTLEEFECGAAEIFNNDGKKMLEAYYSAIIEMVNVMKPTIIGHIDKFKMHNAENRYFDENSAFYKDIVMQSLWVIKKLDGIIEFNTRGLYKHTNKMPYPSLWLLKQIKSLNIRTTINSDSHQPDELIKEFETASQMLTEAGIKSQCRLTNGKWTEVALKHN